MYHYVHIIHYCTIMYIYTSRLPQCSHTQHSVTCHLKPSCWNLNVQKKAHWHKASCSEHLDRQCSKDVDTLSFGHYGTWYFERFDPKYCDIVRSRLLLFPNLYGTKVSMMFANLHHLDDSSSSMHTYTCKGLEPETSG